MIPVQAVAGFVALEKPSPDAESIRPMLSRGESGVQHFRLTLNSAGTNLPRKKGIAMRYSFGILAVICLSLLAVSSARAQTARPTTNTGQTGQAGQAEAVGQITGDERFLRENRQVGQMVGGTTAGVGNLAGQGGPQAANVARGTTNVFGQRGGFNPQQQFGGWNPLQNLGRNVGRAGTQQALRVPIELGFTRPVATLGVNQERIQNRLERIPQIRDMGEVRLQMDGRVAVLQGQVATPQERDLVARMLLLEPGIGDVRNELEVTGP